MIHRVEELVFVDEIPDDKVEQAKKQHKPRAWQDAVHNANDKDKQGLRKVEAITEDRWLHQFRVICISGQHLLSNLLMIQDWLIPRGVLAPIK